MRNILQQIIFGGLSFLVIVCGCSKQLTPDGLPDRVPFTISVTQEGKPLSEASVQLVSPDVPWAITGHTDSSGTAKMTTHGQFGGAPPGVYKVVVRKQETETIPSANNKMQTVKTYSLVDPKCTARQTTPLELTVEKGAKSATLNVGAAVRVLLDTETMPVPEF